MNPEKKQQAREVAKQAVRDKADEFYHSYRTMVKVSYEELKKHGILEAWLLLRGELTLTSSMGEYDWITIGQAVALGLIRT